MCSAHNIGISREQTLNSNHGKAPKYKSNTYSVFSIWRKMQIAIKLQGGQWVNEAYLCVTKLQLYWEEYLVTDFRQQGNKAAKLFKEIDTDGSGYITAAEFKRVLLKQIDRVVDEIHKMDKNGDGKISLKGKQEVGLNNLLGVACEEGNFEKQKG